MYKSERLNSIEEWLEWSGKIIKSQEDMQGMTSGNHFKLMEPKEFPVVSVLEYEIDYYVLTWCVEHVYEKDLVGQPSTLISDGDGHWYICPADKRGFANQYFNEVSWFWREGYKLDGTEEPDQPEWLIPLSGGPEHITFTGWSE